MDSDHALFKSELIAALSDIDQKVKIDWEQFDAGTLLTCYAISACWSWDALIRICGVSDKIEVSGEPESWDGVIRYVNRLRDTQVNFDALASLCVNGCDFPSVIVLAFIVLQFQRARKEIVRRLQDLQVGKQLVFWIDRISSFRLPDLLGVVQPPPVITVRGKKRYLSDPFPNSFDAKEKAETQQSLNIVAALQYYERLKSKVELKSVAVPFSPIANTHPAPRAWEQAFSRIVQQEIDANLAELLPILDRGMEKAPLKSFDLYRTESRREQSCRIQKGEFSEEEDQQYSEEEEDDEMPPLARQIELTSQIHHDELEREKPPDLELLLDKKKRIKKAEELYSKRLEALFGKHHTRQSNRPRIRKGLDLWRENENLERSAKEAGISKNILRPFVIELGLPHLHLILRSKKS